MGAPELAAGNGAGWLVLSAASVAAARAYASTVGLERAAVIDRLGLVRDPGLARLATRQRPEGLIVHTLDWSREEMPQLYMLAAALLAPGNSFLADESRSDGRPSPERLRPATAAAAATAQIAAGLARSAVELNRVRVAPDVAAPLAAVEPRSLVATWSSVPGNEVGGSITHAAGILAALRARGLRVRLISESDPPPQLVAAVDEVEVLPGFPPSHRLSREVRRLAGNRAFRPALERAVRELPAPFIYSRHQAMATAAAEVAVATSTPFVLEWNASERWAIENWGRMPTPLKRTLVPLIGAAERSVVGRASVIAAVSEPAAAMAREAGAASNRVIVVPNAVDVAAVDAALAAVSASRDRGERRPPRIGWVGTFGSWHGASVLIEAIARAESTPSAVLIGDGVEHAACERLADRLGVVERISFPGRLDHDAALAALAGCDILAVPAVPLADGRTFFGSPTKLFEFMAIGRPIVASGLGQIEEVLEDRRTALLVAAGSAADLAAAIDELAAAPELGAALARAARTAAERAHTWEHRAAALIAAVTGR